MLQLSAEAMMVDLLLFKKLKELIQYKKELQMRIPEFENNPISQKEIKDAIKQTDEMIGKIRYHSLDQDNLLNLKSEEDEQEEPIEKAGGYSVLDKLAAEIGISFDKVDKHEFTLGMREEMEHRDITGGKLIPTAKIVMAHLREDPHYYSKLKKVGLIK